MTRKVFLGGVDDGRLSITEWLESAIANPDVLHVYQQECEFFWGWDVYEKQLQPLIQEARKNNNLKFVFGTAPMGGYRNDPLTANRADDIINFTFNMVSHCAWGMANPDNFTDPQKHPRNTGKWHGSYTSLMNKPRDHRVAIFKSILKYDPNLEKGFVTWATQHECYKLHIEQCQEHYPDLAAKISHLEHRLRPQAYNNSSERFNWTQIPHEYHYNWLDIVAETTDKYTFFTEKTWRPIACGKPFIILGHRGQNTLMQNYGFMLFPEIFDYGIEENFADIKSRDPRYKYSDIDIYTMYDRLIKTVMDLTEADILELDRHFQHKYKWNYDLLEYLVMSDDIMPQVCREELMCGNDFFNNRCGNILENRETIKAHRSRIDFNKGIYI